MPEISTAAKKAGRIFFDAMNGTNPNYDICEIVQQAIDEATAEKDAEINRLQCEVDAYELAEAERNAGIIGECQQCVELRIENKKLKEAISQHVTCAACTTRSYIVCTVEEKYRALFGGDGE